MSELPALRDALVGAAARRVRRRRRRAAAVIGWTAVAAAAAALVVLLSGPESRERERPAITPAPQDALERGFSVFSRPATAADALPAGALPGGLDVHSRLALDDGGSRVWLATMTNPKVEGFGGRPEQCAVLRGKGGPASACGGSGGFGSGFALLIPGHERPDSVLFVLPDGARDPQVTLGSGIVLSPTIHDNVALLVPREPAVVGASFTAPSGVREIARWHDLDAKAWTPPARCPALEPLPTGAEALARRAALLAADRIYPGIQEARVTTVTRLGPGLCTRGVSDRSLVVELHLTPFDASQRQSSSLTQGRLLVGMVHGRMTVWMVQH